MTRRLLLSLLLLAPALSGCDKEPAKSDLPTPREVTDAAVGRYCGMALTEHPGPKGQVFVRGLPDPFWFASVRDTFAFTKLDEEPKALLAIYVNDMARAKNWDQPDSGTWIDAKTAWYVIGSRRRDWQGGDEAVPFGQEAAARVFAAENGGRIVQFAGMPSDYILPSSETSSVDH